MRRGLASCLTGATPLVFLAWACNHNEPYTQPDADGDTDADADADLDVDHDEDAAQDADVDGGDGDTPPSPGPLTFIANEVGFVTDRLCDLDGDGDLDNAFADLGSPASDLTVMTLNAALLRGYLAGRPRLLHMPWVDDVHGPSDDSVNLLIFDGVDTDSPANPDDDLSGEEPFWGDAADLDACGEPTEYFLNIGLVDGVVDGSEATSRFAAVPGITTRDVHVLGHIDAEGSGGELLICTYAAIHDIGAESVLEEAGDLTTLEIFLAGGAPFGLATIAGATPDVDLDGDGLETFELDGDSHIALCVDGDLTVISGRDCWADDRMADAFSLNMRLAGVPALFLGREPGWEDLVEGTCDDPRDTSLFDLR